MRLEIIPRVIWSPPSSEVAAERTRSLRRWLVCCIGGLCGVVATELGLVPLTTPLNNVWAPIAADKLDAEVREVRRFTETIAASHFSLSRARLTGNPPIATAPNGVILGDSHVEAVEVSDHETMGAVLERSIRDVGLTFNVRQYGWFGADIPKYVQVAAEVIHVWDPTWVVVVITADDLGPTLLTGSVRVVQHTDGRWGAAADSVAPASGRMRGLAETALNESVLLYHLAKRAQNAGVPLIRAKNQFNAGVASLRPGGLPLPQRALVALSALRDAYGDRLRILFAADVGVDGLRPKSPSEEAVFTACATLYIRCADTADRMAQDRRDSVRLSRGFMNSAPGEGHLNAVGHVLAAETILQDLLAP